MGHATFLQHSFLGGEWSQSVQGRVDRPDYRTAMSVCLNGLPIEQGAWVRRPGFAHAGFTRGGRPARVIAFDFKQAGPYMMEFTDNHLRFRQGTQLVPTLPPFAIIGQNTASPVQVQFNLAPAWSNGDQVYFVFLSGNVPPSNVANRQFTLTFVDATHAVLTDAVTGIAVDGNTTNFVGLAIYRIYDIVTPFGSGLWQSLRSVQAEKQTLLLSGAVQPQSLQALSDPVTTEDALGQPLPVSFSLGAATFLDGPYLDPVPGGATINPGGLSGLVTFTISFPGWDATIAYSVGDFASNAGVNYRSLKTNNLNNTPAGSPTFWQVVSTGVAVGPNGFVGTDVGRMMRFYSEPQLYNVATAYTAGTEVAYPSGVDGGVSYWRCTANNTGVVPGTDATKWAIDAGGAIWTWGRIVSLANQISQSIAGATNFGDLNAGVGVNGAFDGNVSKTLALSPSAPYPAIFVNPQGTSTDNFIGTNYGASPQIVQSATVYPPNDTGFAPAALNVYTTSIFGLKTTTFTTQVTISLRAKNSAPATPSDGILLGSVLAASNSSPVTIISNDVVNAYQYVWVEIQGLFFAPVDVLADLSIAVSQVQFFNPVATSSVGISGANSVVVQLIGSKLLYNTPIRTWRMGLFSNTSGWPSNGVYHEGRVWLSGLVDNRIDGSQSNGLLVNGSINFAPTNTDGSVTDNCGISYIFNAPDVNPIFWMATDAQGIVAGTQGGEWLIQASTQGSAISPTNIQARRWTTNKCANIEPRRVGGPLAVVQFYQRKLLEYFSDVFSGRLGAKNLSMTAPHLTARQIQEIQYQRELAPIIWARMADGSLIGCTYKRENMMSSQDPDFAGWHRHILGSGNEVASIAIGSTFDGALDQLCIVTQNPNTFVCDVQQINNLQLETDPPQNARMLDSSFSPSSFTNDPTFQAGSPDGRAVFGGMWPLNGFQVTVWAAGLDCGDYVVTNGAVSVPYGDGLSGGTGSGLFTPQFASNATVAGQVCIGFTYPSQGQMLRAISPVESGARTGPALGKTRRTHEYALFVTNTAGMTVGTGTVKSSRPVLFKVPYSAVALSPLFTQFFTGVYLDNVNDDYGYNSQFAWEITRPYPAIISAIQLYLQTQDE
jgi:hypothetical protein